MPTLKDDIEIIKTSVYGKEMRPAISDALTQSWSNMKSLIGAVDSLNARVDAIVDGGGDKPEPIIAGGVVAGGAEVSINAAVKILITSGEAIAI